MTADPSEPFVDPEAESVPRWQSMLNEGWETAREQIARSPKVAGGIGFLLLFGLVVGGFSLMDTETEPPPDAEFSLDDLTPPIDEAQPADGTFAPGVTAAEPNRRSFLPSTPPDPPQAPDPFASSEPMARPISRDTRSGPVIRPASGTDHSGSSRVVWLTGRIEPISSAE